MLNFFKNVMMVSATLFMSIAESSTTMMCLGWMDEIELPEELKGLNDSEF